MKLHAETTGRGPALVMLHGWGLHSGVWAPLLPELARRFRVTCVDLPGHGHSGASSAADLPSIAQSVTAISPPGAAWLGWSLGGQVALAAALSGADIDRLVLVASTPRFVAAPDWPWGIAQSTLDGFAASLAQDYRRTVRDFLTLQLRGDRQAAALLATLRLAVARRGEPAPGMLHAGLRILATADLRDQLGGVRQPALVVAGERDRLVPAEAGRRLAESLPDGRLVIFPGAAHAPFLAAPGRFVNLVAEFLLAAAVRA